MLLLSYYILTIELFLNSYYFIFTYLVTVGTYFQPYIFNIPDIIGQISKFDDMYVYIRGYQERYEIVKKLSRKGI